MKTQQELNKHHVSIDYYDVEDTVKGFLTLSALNRINEFDFEEAFNNHVWPINNKLNEHAQLGYEQFLEYYNEVFFHEESNFEPFAYQTDYIYISTDDVKEVIAKMYYDKLTQAFDGMFDNLIEIKDEIDNADYSNIKECVITFDKLIHAQHVTGDIFDDLDIESIKFDLDEEILEIMGIDVPA